MYNEFEYCPSSVTAVVEPRVSAVPLCERTSAQVHTTSSLPALWAYVFALTKDWFIGSSTYLFRVSPRIPVEYALALESTFRSKRHPQDGKNVEISNASAKKVPDWRCKRGKNLLSV